MIAVGLGLQGYSALRVHVLRADAGSTRATTAFLSASYIRGRFELTATPSGLSPEDMIRRLVQAANDGAGWLLGLGVYRVLRPSPDVELYLTGSLEGVLPSGGVEISLPDCESISSCTECLDVRGCGFCAATGKCSSGTRSGPSHPDSACPLSQTMYHHKKGLNPQCPTDCHTLRSCTTCSSR